MKMPFEDIKSLVETAISGAVLGEDLNASPKTLIIAPASIHQVCELLHANEKVYFDTLSCLTGIDNGIDQNTMEVIYNLYSIPYNLHLMLRVKLERDNPEVDSVADIWRGADWHEREAYDLLGIRFSGHSDLRRILLPEDWVGFPMRKDYEQQEAYHEIKVKY